MSVTCERTKVAMIRTPAPIGQPSQLVLNCPCGARPATDGKSTSDVTCACGKCYTGNGWVIA